MVARNVIKNLAVAEDILHGVGEVTQLRNGEVLTVHRVDIPLGISDVSALATVDHTLYPRVRLGLTEYDYVNGQWQQSVTIRPALFVPGVTLDEHSRYVIQGDTIARYIGVTPYVIIEGDDINNAGKFSILTGSGGGGEPVTGGGIIYSNEFPVIVKPEDTYADFERMELVYSYQDGDSSQYLAIPMLAGSGGSASSGGAGGFSTFTSADATGSLVALGSTNEDHRIKAIQVGEGLSIVATGTIVTLSSPINSIGSDTDGSSVVVNGDGVLLPKKYLRRIKAGTNVTIFETDESITINSSGTGGTGGGIEYSNAPPAVVVPGVTYADFEKMEFIFSYNDGSSNQYLAVPMLAGAGGSAISGGSSSSITLANAGSVGDGSALMTNVGDAYSFRRLKPSAAANCTITESGNSVIIEPTIYANAGSTGAVLLKARSVNTIGVKRLLAGTNVTLTEGTDTVTIAAASGGGVTLGDALSRIDTLSPTNNSIMVWTAAGVSQFLSTASTRAMMGLSTVANTIPMFTGTSTATLAALTPYMVGLLAATGVPTALAALKITSGSNVNGGWLRVGTGDTSGVQICWHAIVCNSATTVNGAGFVGAETTWTFPQAFGGLPSVSCSIQDGVNAWITNGASGNSASVARFRQMSFVTGPGNTAVSVLAIGFY